MREWNAVSYHQVSTPQFDWGQRVLERLPLAGDELVLDVGCGTGRLTEKLLERLPRGHAIGVDRSANMLSVAREHLAPVFHSHIHLVHADAAHLPFVEVADAVFSTATFHWVLDHPQLFASIRTALKPGGCFVAQCGGGRNIARVHARAAALMKEAPFVDHFARFQPPWNFADAETTAHRLAEAGFVEIRTGIEPAPVVMPDAQAYAAFITSVICRPHLAHLPDELKPRFIDRMTEQAAYDDPPFLLDYWRLNIDARRPSSSSSVFGQSSRSNRESDRSASSLPPV